MKIISIYSLLTIASLPTEIRADEDPGRTVFEHRGRNFELSVNIGAEVRPAAVGQKCLLQTVYHLRRLNESTGEYEAIPDFAPKIQKKEYSVAIDTKGRIKLLGGGRTSSSVGSGFEGLSIRTESVIEPANNTAVESPMRVTVAATITVGTKSEGGDTRVLAESKANLNWDFSKDVEGRLEHKMLPRRP